MDNDTPNATQPEIYGQNPGVNGDDGQIEKDLNARILQLTMTIKEHYPELTKYIEEMPDTLPDEQNPEMTLRKLQTYYDSLNAILNKYILEHPQD